MAEENLDTGSAKQPPKIKLGNGSSGTPPAQPSKSETTRIDISAAQAAKIPAGGTPKNAEDKLKKSTSRIHMPGEMSPLSEIDRQEVIKKTTVRIETAAGMSPINEEDKQEAAKKSTVRVQIDEERAKGDTARLDAAGLLVDQESKKKTSRIDLKEVLDGDDDIFKRRTALLDASKFGTTSQTAAGAPRTIKIKRPDTPPTTVMKPSPAEEAPAADVSPLAASIEGRKSETARIDLPPEATEQPPTRRKTIRIKRPEGTSSSKPLVISRTTDSVATPDIVLGPSDEEAGPIFSWVAVLAVLVSAVLIYALVAQVSTIQTLAAPILPFPGGI
ncbi:MAG TPA: hypothetical protein PLE77_01525 [Kiritimatiellia bacterium]|nr:hypothetical protein [Kiritimatiellia bacterium]